MVTSVNGNTGTTGTNSNGTNSNGTTTKTASTFENGDFQTFLKMLTAQIQNQDPMNPMESTDFAVQLATFSGVEQQVKTNQLLEKMAALTTSQSLSDLSGWIGKEVKTTAPVPFSQTPLTLDISPAASADAVVLVTHDRFGRVVSRENLGTGSGQVDWLGRDAKGDVFEPGLYSFTLESYRGEELVDETDVPSYARVAEAELGSKGAVLLFQGGGSTLASEVTALRN